MGCNVFNNGKNKNCGFININQENIRRIIEEQKENNITIHNHNKNNTYNNRRNRVHRSQIPVLAPHLRHRNLVHAIVPARHHGIRDPPYNINQIPIRAHGIRDPPYNINQIPIRVIGIRDPPYNINQIPIRENTMINAHGHRQGNILEIIHRENEIDSNNHNNKSEGNKLIDNFCEVRIKNVSKLEESNKKCAICLERFKSKEKVIILPCIHIFHKSCINNWMENQKNCPICKFELTKENIDQKNAYILEE